MTTPNLERLRAEIDLKRAALYELRAELFTLQTDLEGFVTEYEQVVGRIETEIELVESAINELERARQGKPRTDEDLFGGEFRSFAEYFAARTDPNRGSETYAIITPQAPAVNEDDLRALYRRLARQFHPDTVSDPEQKARYTALMARINAAYREKDLAALQALAETPSERLVADATPRTESYADLQRISLQLDEEIEWTHRERRELLHSPLMRLKISVRLARARGEDMLKALAAEKTKALKAARERLAALRGG